MTTLVSTPSDQAVADVFCTAMEGGVNYWASVVQYRWSDGTPQMNQINEFRAVLRDTEDDDLPEYVVDAAVIKRGIRKVYETWKDNLGDDYQSRAYRALHFGKYDDLDFDAETADVVVQFGLFGKLVYG